MALDKPYTDVPGHDDLRRRHVAPGLSPEPVLHVPDEGGEPRPPSRPTSALISTTGR